MKLSIIIVNYNVKHFIEQCLYSVEEAQKECDIVFNKNSTNVFVVDNNSQDGSCEMIKNKFPEVQLIENRRNVGFSTANNQAIKISKAKYVLLLNPDTIVAEDTFIKTIKFMDEHEDAGGLGVKMIDGKGIFLPESKRSLPSPSVSFYKIFGLAKLFPQSKRFSKYHLTYLNKNETHKVDVLSGAFMMLRKETLDKSGLLDETFFMYGEDIDLSYRIKLAGYENYYFSDTSIIHYKGESTKKGSLNYVFMFYNAMLIFAKKHFSNKKIAVFSLLIRLAVWFRAGLSLGKRIFKTLFLPLLDSIIFYSGFYFIKPIWESYNFNTEGYYPKEYMVYAVPVYVLFWILSIYISKGYRKPTDSKKLFRGILSGSFVILILYSLLNEEYRYSRVLLISGTIWAIIFAWLSRALFTIFKIKEFGFENKKNVNLTIFSDEKEAERIKTIIKTSENNKGIKNIIVNTDINIKNALKNTIINNKISEIIFSIKVHSAKEIILLMMTFQGKIKEYMIAHPKTSTIIGSNSIYSSSEPDISDLRTITKPINIRVKRISDIIFSLLFLALYPILVLLVDNKSNFLKNIFNVLAGKISWVGYIYLTDENLLKKLPKIKKGVLSPINFPTINEEEKFRVNAQYAKKYNLTDDIYIIYKSFENIGNKKL